MIDQQGRERKLYLTQMAYSSIAVRPCSRTSSRACRPVTPRSPASSHSRPSPCRPLGHLTLPSAGTQGGTVALAPGQPHLVMFFATWRSEASALKSQLVNGNAYVAAARRGGLPQPAAVDETVVESSAQTVRSYLRNLGTSLNYPVALDTTGRVADGYGVQDQPWFALVSASGKIIWSHDGWLPAAGPRISRQARRQLQGLAAAGESLS